MKRATMLLLIVVMISALIYAEEPQRFNPNLVDPLGNSSVSPLAQVLKSSMRFNLNYALNNIQYGSEYSLQNPGWQNFLAQYGTGWRVMWDKRTGRPNLIEGKGIPFYPGRGNTLNRSDFGELTVDYLHKEIMTLWNRKMLFHRIEIISRELNKFNEGGGEF